MYPPRVLNLPPGQGPLAGGVSPGPQGSSDLPGAAQSLLATEWPIEGTVGT